MEGSMVFQNSTSQAIVRVMSTALCCASGESEMMRSKDSSSRSSKVFDLCLAISMPISSSTAMTKPSISWARTPTESTKMRCPWICFRIASAIGDRTEFIVQQNRTALGRSPAIRLHSDMQRADQREQPSRGVEVDLDLARQALAQDLRALVVQSPSAHVDSFDLRRRGGLDRMEIAIADVEVF